MAEEKTEKVVIGRPVVHENIQYGKGEYMVTPTVARALRAKNATASVAETMRTERERMREEETSGGQGDTYTKTTGAPTSGGGLYGDAPDPTTGQAPNVGAGGGVAFSSAGDSAGGSGGVIIGGKEGDPPPSGGPQPSGVIIGGKPDEGDDDDGPDGGGGRGEPLTGELPPDFPALKKLADAQPPITRYEQLAALTKEQIDQLPGVRPKDVDQIGQRLFLDAQAQGKTL